MYIVAVGVIMVEIVMLSRHDKPTERRQNSTYCHYNDLTQTYSIRTIYKRVVALWVVRKVWPSACVCV